MWQQVRKDVRLSWKSNLIAALPAAFAVTLLCSWTVTDKLRFGGHLTLGLLHFILAYLFLDFFWLPLTWLRRRFLQPWGNLTLTFVLSILLTAGFCLIFPYDFFRGLFDIVLIQWQMETVIIGVHLLFAFVFIKNLRQLSLPALVRALRQSVSRRRSLHPLAEKHVRPAWLVGSFSFIFGLYFVVLFEWWMVNLTVTVLSEKDVHEQVVVKKIPNFTRPDSANFLHLPKLFQPYKWIRPPGSSAPDEPSISESPTPMQKWAGTLLPKISITLSGAFMLFLSSIVPLCLMSFVLPSVQHNETAYLQRLAAAPTYAGQFYLAIIAQNPLFSITSLVMLIFLIAMPLIVTLGNKPEFLYEMIGTDQILFIFTLLAAWISPLIYAGVHVDRTFGSYFNTKLSNLILGVRDHVVVLGFGDLGQRVVNRELMKVNNRYRQAERFRRILSAWQSSRSSEDEWLEKVVSPDLHVEYLCVNFIIVDRNADNFLFATNNDVLGAFGVVGALEQSASSTERLARQRVLVPIVQGDATEPFTLSRVNLERASFLISTVSQDERIREIFSRAVEVGLRSIICVSRSNHMINLPHKAPGHPIALVYPKQNSGVTLGQRLIAATLKVQPALPPGQAAPRVIVVGMNKSNHFLLDVFWHSLANLDDSQKARFFHDNLRFIVTSKADIYTATREDLPVDKQGAPARAAKMAGAYTPQEGTCFTHQWRSSFITGFRYFQSAGTERPLHFTVPACVMQADEASLLERCYAEFRPDIVVINDDEVENSRMLLLRSVNSLERLKYEKPRDFRLPLILMSATRGDEIEQKDIGDVFQFYEALNRLYKEESQGPGYPRNAYYRRQAPPRRVIGDSVQDALADTEEIISGIRDNWALGVHKSSGGRADVEAKWDDAFELNTCLMDTAGSLARLTARLAGLEFSRLANEPIEKFFPNRRDGTPAPILRPSFQYIRHLKLDVEGRGFCLTGFADLQENTKEEIVREPWGDEEAIAARVFAKDAHNYMNRDHDDFAAQNLPVPRLLKLATSVAGEALDTQTFVEVMMGASQRSDADASRQVRDVQNGETFCPGMTTCPIASYQHSIVSNNARAFEIWRNNRRNPLLRAATNYGCSTIPVRKKPVQPHQQYARIFYCCHADRNSPGLIAIALNLLNFQRFARLYNHEAREQNLDDDWIVDVEYFKDTPCQNRLFSLNRLFGARRFTKDLLNENNWTMKQYEKHQAEVIPFSLLQIMPVGDIDVARRWFDYAAALYRYLEMPESNRFHFQWWDQNEQRQTGPTPTLETAAYPVAIQINKLSDRQPALSEQDCCAFCGVADPELTRSCAQRRPWIERES